MSLLLLLLLPLLLATDTGCFRLVISNCLGGVEVGHGSHGGSQFELFCYLIEPIQQRKALLVVIVARVSISPQERLLAHANVRAAYLPLIARVSLVATSTFPTLLFQVRHDALLDAWPRWS